MTTQTHKQRVAEMQAGIAQQDADTYRKMLDLAQFERSRGNHAEADQHERSAENFADTRMSIHARRIAGIA